jgi:CrcB protein
VIVVWVALAGGLGAVSRYVVDGLVRSRVSASFPVGTVLINVSGSFVLGVVTGLVLARAAPEALRLVVGTGFCGGYTTFSTASFETVRLVEQRRVALALLNAVGTLVVTVSVGAAGLWLGTALVPL